MTENEVWRDIVGYEGLYKVSNKGNVYSIERKDSNNRKRGGFTLKQRYNKNGYFQVGLHKNSIGKNKYIHRLVADAFIPNPNNLPQVNHIDEVKSNNNIENLEWCTSKQNNNHGTRTERFVQQRSKKVRAVNVKTGEVVTFNSTQEARRKGYSNGHVSSACNGNYKSNKGKLIGGDGRTYRGYRWYYE